MKRQVQKDGWTRSVATWKRVVQKAVGKDEDGHDILEIEEHDTMVIREDFGTTSVFAENERILSGLKRVHIYAA